LNLTAVEPKIKTLLGEIPIKDEASSSTAAAFKTIIELHSTYRNQRHHLFFVKSFQMKTKFKRRGELSPGPSCVGSVGILIFEERLR
jgi:hypothetical protein